MTAQHQLEVPNVLLEGSNGDMLLSSDTAVPTGVGTGSISSGLLGVLGPMG